VLEFERGEHRNAGQSFAQRGALVHRRLDDRELIKRAPVRADQPFAERRAHAPPTDDDQLKCHGPTLQGRLFTAAFDAGVHQGLSRDVSRQLVVGTFEGSAALLKATGESPEELRAQVTSPGGTTAAGLRMLEGRAVRAAFLEAVAAATERSRQLGR
jgi:hypothetical protein